jgi:hypothetical protein
VPRNSKNRRIENMQGLPSKPFLFTALFYRGPIEISVLPDAPGVDLPAMSMDFDMAVVEFRPNDPEHTSEVTIGHDRLTAKIAVGAQKYDCVIPWNAVSSIEAHEDDVVLTWTDALFSDSFVDEEFDSMPSIRLEVLDGGDVPPGRPSELPGLRLIK